MQKPKYLVPSLLVIFTVVSVLTGCSRDPKVRRDKFLRSGEQYFDKGDYQAASIQFQRSIQIDSHYAEAYYRLALTDLKLRRWQDAYRSLQKSIQNDPNHVPARLELARLEFAARQTADADQEVEAALAKDPGNFDAHLLSGQLALSAKDYQQALKEFETCQEIAPKNPAAFVQAGDTYVLLRQYPQALQAFQKAIEVDASYTSAYLDLAQAYRVQGDLSSELTILQSAIAHNPQQIAPYLATASAYVRQGQSAQLPDLFSKLRTATENSPATLLSIGEFYFAVGDAIHAKAAFDDALAKDKKNNVIRKRLIELELNQHNWDDAEKLNGELLKAEPNDSSARLFQARLQFVRGAKAKAITSLEQLVHDSPEMALPRFYLGVAYATQGESGRAVAALNDTVQHDPNFIWAYIGLAELYAQQGNPKLALEFANRSLARNPNFVPAILLQANAYMQLGDYNAALSKLQPLAAAQPKNPAIMERLAVVAFNQKQYGRAEELLENALKLQPDYVLPMLDLTQLYSAEKRGIDQIIGRLQQQIAFAPKQSSFNEILGGAYLGKGDSAKAQEAFEETLKLNEDATQARLQLARLYASKGEFTEALRNAEKVLASHPDFLPGYILLGTLYEQTGDIPKAEQAYQQALQRKDDFAPALNNLAWLYCENNGNLDLALGLAQKAKAAMPADPSVSDTLAWIEYRKGLYTVAARQLQDLTREKPSNGLYQYHLGMTLIKTGETSQATEFLQRSLNTNPAGAYVQNAKTALAELRGKS